MVLYIKRNKEKVIFQGYTGVKVQAYDTREAIKLAKEFYYYRGENVKGKPKVISLTQ